MSMTERRWRRIHRVVVAVAGAFLAIGGVTLTAWAQDPPDLCTHAAAVDLMPGSFHGGLEDWTVAGVRVTGLSGCVGEPLRLRLLGADDVVLFEVVTDVSAAVMAVPVSSPVAVGPVVSVTLDLVAPAPAPTPTVSPTVDVDATATTAPSLRGTPTAEPTVAVSPAVVARAPAPVGTALPRTGMQVLGVAATAVGLALVGIVALGAVRRRQESA